MNHKTRLQKLESQSPKTDGKFIVLLDADGDKLAEFDGVQMTQAEAEAKAAALPDNVLLIHVSYVDYAELQNAGGVQ